MTQVSVTKTINVPATKVWEKVSSFRGIEEFSPVERSVAEGEGVGASRKCYLPDCAEISERLEMENNSTMTLQYKISKGPFLITDYLSTVKVKALGDNTCEMTWGRSTMWEKKPKHRCKNCSVVFTM